MSIGPTPQVGSDGDVTLDEIPLRYVPGSYVCREAERFGEKISTGRLTYADFNAYESSHAVSNLTGGYGLREYTALTNPDDGIEYYDDADAVDPSYGGVILGPRVFSITLPGMDASSQTPVFVGEMTPAAGPYAGTRLVVCVIETKIFIINADFSVTDTGIVLDATATTAAVFNGNLIIGFDTASGAVYTADLVATNAILTFVDADHPAQQNIYVFAIAADRSAVYIAGSIDGATNQVTSAVLGTVDYDPNFTTCGGSDGAIKSLAPGGGIVILYIGKEDEVGAIDATDTYRSLVPFDSRLSTNCTFLRWWMGTPGEQQRGPLVLLFPRDNNLWMYEPSSQNAGQASNLSVGITTGFRPRIRGYPTAAQGTARFLYYATTNDHDAFDAATETMQNVVFKRDVRTGAVHPYINLGDFLDGYPAESKAMTVTSLFGPNPVLLLGSGHSLVYVTLPLDGNIPLDDPAMYYTAEGRIDLPGIELGFPDEDKISFEIHVISKNCSAGQREIDVYLAYEDEDFGTLLGTIYESPSQTVRLDTYRAAKKIRLRFVLRTYDPQRTPQLQGFSLRVSINPVLRRIWEFDAYVPFFDYPHGGQALDNPKTAITSLWQARQDGVPVNFTDRWRDLYTVRILKMQEKEVAAPAMETPVTQLSFMLLEFGRQPGTATFDDPATVFDSPETGAFA